MAAGGLETLGGRVRGGARFLRSFLRSPRQVGAVIPTSSRAVSTMLDMVALDEASCVVEMGAGTGPYTRGILRRLRPDARFLAFEIDAELARGLERDVRDPRLRVINDSAEHMERYLDGRRADVVVSAIPFTSLPAPVRDKLFEVARANLADDGTLLVLQYSPFMQGRLERSFAFVERRIAPMNVPPAFLFACRAAR
jgi:phospholipid N-methyltransferase